MPTLSVQQMSEKLKTQKKVLSPAEMQAKLASAKQPQAQPQEDQGGFFSNLARSVARTPLTFAGTAQSGLEAAGQLLTGQGDKAAETISKGSERMRQMEKDLGYKEGEISRPYRIGQDVSVQDGKMTGGGFGSETTRSLGAGAELASYGMGVPEAESAFRLAKGVSGAGTLAKIGFATAKKEAIAGAVGSAGSAMQEKDASLGSVAGSALAGGAMGAAAGFVSPFAGKAFQKIGAWSKSADDAVEAAYRAENKVDTAADWSKRTPIETDKPLQKSLDEVDDILFPPKAEDAPIISEATRKQAVKAGISRGRIETVSQMSQAEKHQALQMMDLAENRELNELAEHPESLAAKPSVETFEHIRKVNKESGAALDGLVDAMPKEPVPLAEPTIKARTWIDDKNIRRVVDQKGNQSLDFSQSIFRDSPQDQKMINNVFKELHPKQAKGQYIFRTPEEVRTMRQRLFKVIQDNTKSNQPFSDQVTPFLEGIRQELNAPLARLSPEYAEANKNYAVSRQALERFMKFAGGHFNEAFMSGDNEIASQRMAELLRRSMGASPARTNVEFSALSRAAKQTGMAEQAVKDPRRLLLLNQTLEELFDMPRETSFKEQVRKGVIGKIGEGVGVVKDVVTAKPISAVERVIGMFDGDQKLKARKALRKLLSDGLVDEPVLSPRGGNTQFAGAFAGIEPEVDENGKPTGKIKFNPEKAAAGVLGMGALKKVAPELLEKAEEKITESAVKTDRFLISEYPTSLMHGTSSSNSKKILESGFRVGSGQNSGGARMGYGVYLDNSKDNWRAKEYGKSLLKTELKPGLKLFDWSKIKELVPDRFELTKLLDKPSRINDLLQDMGYDGAVRPGLETVIFDPKNIVNITKIKK